MILFFNGNVKLFIQEKKSGHRSEEDWKINQIHNTNRK